MHFETGSRVAARGLAWDLVESEPLGAQQRLRLRCAAGDLRGLEWDVLFPAEPVQALHAALRPETPASLTAWRLHQIACLLEQALGPDDMLAAQPGRVTIEPYQFVPLMRALEMPRPRLLLADGVGLGKTVQAGLIVTEMIARRRAHRILVVVPAGPLLVQWAQELRHRFGLRFTAVTDSAVLQRERRGIELGGNPFDSIALCLIALDFAKQERVLEELERATWDLAIIDEAHHCVGGLLDSEATLRRRLAEVVARQCDGLLLLTATPHDGYDAHFASLIELLDPSLVDGRGGLAGMAYRHHVVRRLKSHIRNPATGEPLFRQRRVIPVRIEARAAAPVQAFHTALAALVAPRLRRAQRDGDSADALAFIGLLKRSVSTIGACVETLRVVAERYGAISGAGEVDALRRERARALRAYRRRRLRYGVLDATSETNAAELEAEDMAAELSRSCAADAGRSASSSHDPIVRELQDLIMLGGEAALHDPKLLAMLDEVRLIRAAHPHANILIYTEYADSQLAVLDMLRQAAGVTGKVLAISGLDPEAERTGIAERFAEQDGLVLVSTDSMAEGLNLQRRCFHLIHLDLPYNPNRLEQRNGRIDRYGQTRDPEIRYLYLAGTFEERLLLRLIAKYEKARARLDLMPDTLGVTADEADWDKGLVAGFAEDQAGLFEDETPVVRTLDRAVEASNAAALRDLVHEIDRAFAGFERHAVRHGWLAEQGINADLRQVRAAERVRRRSESATGCVDLADFVAAAIAMDQGETHEERDLPLPLRKRDGGRGVADRRLRSATPSPAGHPPAASGGDVVLRLPGDWSRGIDDLPGFDLATRTLRITHDRDHLRNAQADSLAFLGRAHPLVRRAIGRVHQTEIADASGTHDTRVSAAQAACASPMVLLTFSIEIASEYQIEHQQVIAVLLPKNAAPTLIDAPAEWLRYAAPDRAITPDRVWQDHFAAWVPMRSPHAERLAHNIMQRIADHVVQARRAAADRDTQNLERWLKLRADDICGVWQSRTADLFGAAPDGPVWKLLSQPLDRLAAYAAGADNPPPKRREANSAVSVFRDRIKEQTHRLALSVPRLRTIGMLMLMPEGGGA
jgi:superfamily II DNA or RNA helicase